jgi:hypothetical protein
MAKGQKRSGREPKKPKASKKPTAPATTPHQLIDTSKPGPKAK